MSENVQPPACAVCGHIEPPPLSPLDTMLNEIGYCRMKGEDDEAFKQRAANVIEQEEWVRLGKKAQKRLDEIVGGTGPDADATEMAAIRTILERVDGEPVKKIEVGGKGGGPIQYQIINYGGDDTIGK